MEPGERIEEALKREVAEELGAELTTASPLLFKDAVLAKTFADGSTKDLHMVFLVYRCTLDRQQLSLNDEFSDYAWVDPSDLGTYELDTLTRGTLASAGLVGSGELEADRPETD